MSLLSKYLQGWSFRTTTPSFEEGQEVSLFVTGRDGDAHVARVGDTILAIPNAPDGAVDTHVRVRVTAFDDGDHTGEAEYLETVGESAF